MVVEFTTAYAISVYPYLCCMFESRSGRSVQHYVIKLVSDLRQVVVFSVSSSNKTDCHDINEIVVQVTLSTIKQTNNIYTGDFILFFHAFIFRADNYYGSTIYFGSRNTHGRCKGTVNLLFGATLQV